MGKILTAIKGFFGAAKTSIKGVVNGEELVKAVATSVAAGGSFASVVSLLQTLITDAPLFIPNPAIAGLVSAILALILDLYRRKAQGVQVAGITPGIAAPAPADASK